MNPYNFSVLFFAFCSFFISILIWLKRGDAVGKIYFIFSFVVTIWAVGWAIMVSSNVSYSDALFVTRFSQMVSMFIPVIWLHFVSVLTYQRKKIAKLLYLLYFLTSVVGLFGFTSWFVPKLESAVGFAYYTRPGFLYHYYPSLYLAVVPIGFMLLVARMNVLQGEERLQFKGLFIATFVGFIGGSFCFLPVYEVMVPPYGVFLLPVYPFVMAYFMMRHRLFDMEQIIELFQREKLATIGLLAASVNHEIRNPLYAAQSLLETYLENKKEGLHAKNPDEISERALSQIKRALDVIGKLNRFAKPSTEVALEHSGASIFKAVQTVLDLVSYEFELDKIHIKAEIPEDFPEINAEQRHLEEILFNLVVNACHAMKKGTTENEPRTTIIGTLELRGTWDMDRVTIAISDTGIGIPQEGLERLFEPFYTTKGDKGTGLGLYITKQLVERNGGKVSVKSELGKGTTFVLEFRIRDK